MKKGRPFHKLANGLTFSNDEHIIMFGKCTLELPIGRIVSIKKLGTSWAYLQSQHVRLEVLPKTGETWMY